MNEHKFGPSEPVIPHIRFDETRVCKICRVLQKRFWKSNRWTPWHYHAYNDDYVRELPRRGLDDCDGLIIHRILSE